MLAKAFAVLPELQFKSLAIIYIYNVNSSLRQFVKVHERNFSPFKVVLPFLSLCLQIQTCTGTYLLPDMFILSLGQMREIIS